MKKFNVSDTYICTDMELSSKFEIASIRSKLDGFRIFT